MSADTPTNEDLLKAARNGDEDALAALHEILAVFGREIGSVISPFGDTSGPATRHTRAAAGRLGPVCHRAAVRAPAVGCNLTVVWSGIVGLPQPRGTALAIRKSFRPLPAKSRRKWRLGPRTAPPQGPGGARLTGVAAPGGHLGKASRSFRANGGLPRGARPAANRQLRVIWQSGPSGLAGYGSTGAARDQVGSTGVARRPGQTGRRRPWDPGRTGAAAGAKAPGELLKEYRGQKRPEFRAGHRSIALLTRPCVL
jgi:hypothetical protein